MKAYEYTGAGRDNCKEIPIPEELQAQAEEYREKLMDEVSETSDSLMERYLEGDEISHEEIVAALKEGTNHGALFPVTCGVVTRNLGTNRLLDAIVEDLPSPVKHGGLQVGEMTLEAAEDGELFAYVFKTRADPFAGRINLFRVYQGVMKQDSQVLNTRTHSRERIGQLVTFEGAETGHTNEFGPGDIGAVAKLKETRAGDWLAARDEAIEMPSIKLPGTGDGVRDRAQEQGRRGQGVHGAAPAPGGGPDDRPAPRRADRRADRRRPLAGPRRGDRRAPTRAVRRRGHAEAPARALPGDDPRLGQGARPPQEADRRPRPVRRLPHRDRAAPSAGEGFEFVNAIKGGVIPTGFIPAVEKGVQEAMHEGIVAGYPVKDVRVRLYDGSYHTVDSSEMAFKVAGSQAMKQALEQASPVLLEPIMLVTVNAPEETVGDVIGDLNSRRGRPLGMEPAGAGMTDIKAEVPMAEMLSYAPDLRSITGGQGEFTMEFARYEEVPGHLAAKVVDEARAEREAVKA